MIIIQPEDYGVDYSKLEFKTFCYVWTDSEGNEHADLYEYDAIKARFPELMDRISEANARGEHYIKIGAFPSKGYAEIQWD